MTGSAAQGRDSVLLPGQRPKRGDSCRSDSASGSRCRRSAALAVLLGSMVWMQGAAQTAVPHPIRAEFRTSPRPLVTQTIDRGRMETASAVRSSRGEASETARMLLATMMECGASV